MRLHSVAVHARSVSPATWCALTVLVLLLAALSLFLIGCSFAPGAAPTCALNQTVQPNGACVDKAKNYYECFCDCEDRSVKSASSPGARVTAAGTANVDVYNMPPHLLPIITTESVGSQGTLVNGPLVAALNGVSYTWWGVDWDDGASGWSIESFLSFPKLVDLKGFDVCLPPSLNANRGGTTPTATATLASDCTTRVTPEFQASVAIKGPLPPGAQCGCGVSTVPAPLDTLGWVNECDGSCPALSGVCLVMGTDPPQPTPDPVAAGVFEPTSVCQVSGDAEISVGGHTPKTQPKARGLLQIHGKPCQGQGCQVGLAYQLTADDIEFDSGTIFASDPKFVDLSVSGATQPNGVNLGLFLGFYLGDVTAVSSARGRSSGSSQAMVEVASNAQPLALAVNWQNKTCRLSGNSLSGTLKGENNEDLAVTVDVTLDGVLLNQPPLANAGRNQTLECTSPAGAQLTLDASGSTDPDNNIAFYIWRRGSDTGSLVGDPSPSPTRATSQPAGTTTYYVRVVDSQLAADNASVNVSVVDTTPPTIDCHAPATITPPDDDDAPIAFRATASDICSAPPPVVIDSVACFHVKRNGELRPSRACRVTIQGDTITIHHTGGRNGIIRWLTHATDGAGNVGQRTCEVRVVKPPSESDGER